MNIKRSVILASLSLIFVIGFTSSQNVYSEESIQELALEEIESHLKNIIELEEEIDSIYEEIDSIDDEIDSMDEETMEEEIEVLEEEIESLETNIISLDEQIESIEDEIGLIEDEIELIEGEIESTEGEIKSIEDEIESLEIETLSEKTYPGPVLRRPVPETTTLTQENKTKLSDWVKSSARWWSSGALEDSYFSSGIKHLIKEKVVDIPQVQTKKEMSTFSIGEIPNWVKHNARWWSQGYLSDDDFVRGIEYMIKVGIIEV